MPIECLLWSSLVVFQFIFIDQNISENIIFASIFFYSFVNHEMSRFMRKHLMDPQISGLPLHSFIRVSSMCVYMYVLAELLSNGSLNEMISFFIDKSIKYFS